MHQPSLIYHKTIIDGPFFVSSETCDKINYSPFSVRNTRTQIFFAEPENKQPLVQPFVLENICNDEEPFQSLSIFHVHIKKT